MKAEMGLAERLVQIADTQGTPSYGLESLDSMDHGLPALLSPFLSEGF